MENYLFQYKNAQIINICHLSISLSSFLSYTHTHTHINISRNRSSLGLEFFFLSLLSSSLIPSTNYPPPRPTSFPLTPILGLHLSLFISWHLFSFSLLPFHNTEVKVKVIVDQSYLILCCHQALLSMGFSWQEHWNGLPFLSPGDLPGPWIESQSPALQAGSLLYEPPGKPPWAGSIVIVWLLAYIPKCNPFEGRDHLHLLH